MVIQYLSGRVGHDSYNSIGEHHQNGNHVCECFSLYKNKMCVWQTLSERHMRRVPTSEYKRDAYILLENGRGIETENGSRQLNCIVYF